jgi:hypothetical protein
LAEDLRRKDDDHLKLLAVFHFVLSGLALLGIGFLFLHYSLMSKLMPQFGPWKNGSGMPVEFGDMLFWYYLIMGAVLVAGCLANLFAGMFLRQRRHRMFCLVVAGFNCLMVPFGTVLGIFTFIVLLRDSVRRSYEV